MDLLMRRRALMGGKHDALDTDGLIGYWDYSDAPVNNKWVDRINSFTLDLMGTTESSSSGYHLNNLSHPKDAYAVFTSGQNATLNNLVTNTFTCIVECDVRFTQVGMNAQIIDFGSVGASGSRISVMARLHQDGTVSASPKIRNASTGFSELNKDTASGVVIPLNTLTHITCACGTWVMQNGKQEVFCEMLGAKAYGIKDSPANIGFNGCNGATNAFALGIGYLANGYAEQYAPNSLSDVYYKKILLYNKHK